jgi:hypothetical protein
MAYSPSFKKGRSSLSDPRFKQKPLHGCSGCRQDFTSLALFDRHRVGTYEYTLEQGLKLDPPQEDGRRCLDTDEMKEKGWEQDDRGRWIDPVRVQASREAFLKAA